MSINQHRGARGSSSINQHRGKRAHCVLTNIEEQTAHCLLANIEEQGAYCLLANIEEQGAHCLLANIEEQGAHCLLANIEEQEAHCLLANIEEQKVQSPPSRSNKKIGLFLALSRAAFRVHFRVHSESTSLRFLPNLCSVSASETPVSTSERTPKAPLKWLPVQPIRIVLLIANGSPLFSRQNYIQSTEANQISP